MEQEDMIIRYFGLLDEFISIKRVNDVREIFQKLPVNGMEYKSGVINACVLRGGEGISLDLKQFEPGNFGDILYNLVIDVNPRLEISKVSFAKSKTGGVHKCTSRDVSEFRRDFKRRIIGQKRIMNPLLRGVRRFLYGVRDTSKPAGVFLLPGPTGTGKTETAKALSEILFNGKIVRIDCSEYSLPHEYSKLIGSPPGYVGHGKEGCLTGAIKKNPRSVVLFDEIEQAHHKVHGLLYQILDEGSLVDGENNRVSFGDTFIFLTSNLGCENVQSFNNRIGFGEKKGINGSGFMDDVYHKAIREFFGEALLGRVNDVVIYDPLSLEMAVKVASLEVKKEARNFRNANVHFSCTNRALEEIARRADFKTYGGRDIKRVITGQISDSLLDMVGSGEICGNSKVRVGFRNGSFSYSRE